MTKEQQQQFLEKLLSKKSNNSAFSVVYKYFDDGTELRLPKLAELLSIDQSLLTEDGKEALGYLESLKEESNKMMTFEKFKVKLMIFLSIQDLLSTPLFPDTTTHAFLQVKYFYYESKYILTEMIVSSLNGLHIANKHLLRNFLEFNLQQCYFINKIKKENSFQIFTNYIKNRNNPNTGKLVTHAIPDEPFCKPIKKRIQLELDNLSSRYSHAYNQDESPKHQGIFRPGLTIESLYFYVQASVTLDVVLWTYYVNFPMLFRPVNIVRKFGFSPPALFVTEDVTKLIKRSMSTEDFEAFEKYASNSQEVKDHFGWYESMPDMSEEEIWKQWDKPREANDTIETCYLKMTATVRAFSELLVETEKEKELRLAKEEAVDDAVVESYLTFSKWQKAYKNAKK